MQGRQPGRPVTYLALTNVIKDEHSDDDTEICIELGTPCWGEEPAGYEWQQEVEGTLKQAG